MDKLNYNQKYKITTLSPIHIGNGDSYQKYIDFVPHKNGALLYDTDEIFDKIANDRKAIDELYQTTSGTQSNIHNFVEKQNLVLENTVKIPFKVFSFNIQKLIRNGMGYPQIPGSSLKGGLRSALYAHYFSRLSKQKQKELLNTIQPKTWGKFAAREIERELFGSDPTQDLMKAFIVTDADFSKENVKYNDCRILSLKKNGGWSWKTKKVRGNTFPMNVYFEAIRENASSYLTLGIDQFLLKNPNAQKKLGFDKKLSADFTAIHSVINQHTENLIDQELDFLYDHDKNNKLKAITSFYEKLRYSIPEPSKGCLLRIGWGSGWKFITGNILKDHPDHLKKFRKQFKMGRKGFSEYPKSRKIIMSGRNPATVPGWIKLEQV
ncbi:MAG: type III-A CRISPR-associated RAMP protein Csm5 [Candidatus Marinimicrobia bacterium]|nr:type III-A CRISPR-associated RAMP protein Csm5 [Candidatus Neomarinimicrobiota bacterium]